MTDSLGFDIISDLKLGYTDLPFSWTKNAIMQYCIVAGNVSHDINVVQEVLIHLSECYEGVFYVPGELEYEGMFLDIQQRTQELKNMANSIPGVFILCENVMILNGVAIVGTNGWNSASILSDSGHIPNIMKNAARANDITYIRKTIQKLQRHLDVRKIIMVSSAVPGPDLYFEGVPNHVLGQTPLHDIRELDTEKKITYWVYGSQSSILPVDDYIENINFLSNPVVENIPYRALNLLIYT